MELDFHAAALEELEAAVQWYADEDPALGRRFYEEVRRRVAFAARFPNGGPVWRGMGSSGWEARAFALRHFPYTLVTLHREGSDTVVLAVAHTKRAPGYWKTRIGTSGGTGEDDG